MVLIVLAGMILSATLVFTLRERPLQFTIQTYEPVITCVSRNLTLQKPHEVGTLIDGTNLQPGDRVLFRGQASSYENGIWEFDQQGNWKRSNDLQCIDQICVGRSVPVLNTQSSYVLQVINPGFPLASASKYELKHALQFLSWDEMILPNRPNNSTLRTDDRGRLSWVPTERRKWGTLQRSTESIKLKPKEIQLCTLSIQEDWLNQANSIWTCYVFVDPRLHSAQHKRKDLRMERYEFLVSGTNSAPKVCLMSEHHGGSKSDRVEISVHEPIDGWWSVLDNRSISLSLQNHTSQNVTFEVRLVQLDA